MNNMKYKDLITEIIRIHQKSEHQRSKGFPRADKLEYYCTEDQQPWPCETIKIISNTLGLDNDR